MSIGGDNPIGSGPIGGGPIGPWPPADITIAIDNTAELAYAGQGGFIVNLNFVAWNTAQVAVQAYRPTFRMTVKPVYDNYYYCGRTGFRLPLERLVEDGYRPGLFVEKGWDDPPHPQDYPVPLGPDGIRASTEAPSQDPPEDFEQVELVIDGETYLV